MPSETVFLESCHDQTRIETYVTFDNNLNDTAPAVILAHPYGPLGGSMRNNVVMSLHNYFASKGFITVCINFRGCGNSKGRTSWTGMPERGDYEAVIQYLKTSGPRKLSHLIISGYSYGSMIAASMPRDEHIPYSYLLISHPLSVQWALATVRSSFFTTQANQLFKESDCNILVVFGDHDQFTGAGSYQKWVKHAGKHVETVLIPGADHFWYEYENKLVATVNEWVTRI